MPPADNPASLEANAILDAAGTMMIACDRDGTVRIFNPAAERLLGWTAAEVIGRHTPALWHDPEEIATRAAKLSQEIGRTVAAGFEVFTTKASNPFHEQREWTFIRKDGSRFPVQLSVSPVRDQAGRLTGYLGTAEDLTARVQAEEERDRFFNLSLDMLGIASTDGYFKRINPAFRRTLGWTEEEILAQPFINFVHPDDRAATLVEVEKLASGQPTVHFQNRYCCKDGTTRWLSWTTTSQPDGTLYASARDVTALKQAEDALYESRQDLAITLNSIGDAVMATDAVRRITRMNPTAEQLTGWPESEAIGRPIDEVFHIVHEETRRPATIPVDDVLATGAVQGLANHTALISRDGTEWPIADSAAPIRDETGRINGVVLVFRDVGDERKLERELHRLNVDLEKRVQERTAALAGSRATYETLSRVSPVGILLFNAVGQCVDANRRWCEMTDLTRERALRDGWRSAIHPADRDRVVEQGTAAVQNKQPFFSEHRLQPRHGHTIWVVGQTEKIVDPRGEVTGYVRTLTDVTQQKQTEQALRLLSGMLATLSGTAFYEAVTLHLAELLDIDIVSICRRDLQQPDHFHTLAIAIDGQIQANFSYPATGTPCAEVWEPDTCIVPCNVQQQYPDDAYFVEQQIEAYAGVPLIDSAGRQVGHISALSRTALHDPANVESVLSLFAVSVAAEMECQELARNYSDLFELSPDAIILTNLDGVIVQANSQVETLFGWKRSELVGQSVELLVPPEDRAGHAELRQKHVAASARRVRDDKCPTDLRAVRRLRRDGEIIFVDIVLSPMETVHGTLVAASLRDVSERQNMLDELHQAKAFADTVIESVSGLFYVLDHEGTYFRWNKVAQELLGLSSEEMRQTHALATIHEDDRKMIGDKIAEAFREGSATAEAKLLTKDGCIHTLLNGRRMEIGGAVYLVGSGADITHRKQAEEEIRQLSQTLEQRVQERTAELSAANADIEKLAIVATHCQHGVVIADAEGRIEWVNEAFQRLTGYSSNEVLGKKAGVFLQGPRTDPAALKVIRQGLKSRENISIEIINYTKEGREFWNALKINPVYNQDGELVRFVGTQTDITERKQAEQNLMRARQAAEQASQAKSEFLATMSHELRTPLNGVLGMNELLLRTELTEQQRQLAEAGSSSGKLLVQLINDILDLSKIEAGKLELDPRQCDIAALIEGVVEMLSHSAQQKGIVLTCPLAPEARVTGVCDDGRVRQVLVNLVANALKFTSSGAVTISGDRRQQPDGTDRLRIAVSDTGIGIPEERLDRLFKSFSQIDSSTTRRFGGTGLGLSICQQLIVLMGGEIGVESQVGVGSIFWFEIPLQIATDDASAPDKEPSLQDPDRRIMPSSRVKSLPASSGSIQLDAHEEDSRTTPNPPTGSLTGHVLVAEDNEINQLYIGELLKYLNCTCDVVANGEEALVSVERGSYDLVLMDCQMPEMDGFVATQEIRKREAAGQLPGPLPIVALTANALKGDRERCLDAGMNDYLSKPIENARLQEVLQKYLSGSSEDPLPAGDGI